MSNIAIEIIRLNNHPESDQAKSLFLLNFHQYKLYSHGLKTLFYPQSKRIQVGADHRLLQMKLFICKDAVSRCKYKYVRYNQAGQ